MEISRKEKWCERIFVLMILGFVFAWAVIQPYNSSPDEGMRYDLIQYIYENNTLPRGDDPAIRNEMWGISYGFNPYLSGLISVFFMKIAGIFTDNGQVLLIAARMTGVFCIAGLALLAIKISRFLFSGLSKWVFVSLIALLPEVLFLGSYLNNDSLALLATAWIIYIWTRVLKEGWTWKNCIGLGIAISVCTLSYYNAYGVILCSILLFCITILGCQEKKWDWKTLFGKGMVIAAIVGVLAGWWFVRNYIIYDGDFLGMKTSNMSAQLYAIEELKPSNRVTPQSLGISIKHMLFGFLDVWGVNWTTTVFKSFIGVFGYMTVFMPGFIPKLYAVLYAIGIIGVVPAFRYMLFLDKGKDVRSGKKECAFNWMMLLAAVIPVVLCFYYAYASDFQAQGRYIMPMLVPFIYYITKGYEYLLNHLVKNEIIRKVCYGILLLFAAMVSIYAYFGVFVPSFH